MIIEYGILEKSEYVSAVLQFKYKQKSIIRLQNLSI